MGVAAACTAAVAYLIGEVVNQAYVNRNFRAIALLGGLTIVLFTVKGAATYVHAVMLSRIGNRIVAENQRRMFDKLMQRKPRLFRRPPFLRIPGAPHRRRDLRDAGAEPPDQRLRPRPSAAARRSPA